MTKPVHKPKTTKKKTSTDKKVKTGTKTIKPTDRPKGY